MITKEKHFTKCETPNSSRIVEDKQQQTKEAAPDVAAVAAVAAVPEDKPIAAGAAAVPVDDSSVNGQKVGTVIPNRIFVGGFAPKTIDEDLWKFFSAIANITAAKIIYDRSGVSKCYGFVTFANPKEAKHIVKQSGGAMLSPMGRLRISQAVRKMVPHYSLGQNEYAQIPASTPMSVVHSDGYYVNPSQCPPKPSVCLAYPVQQTLHHHVSAMQHVMSSAQPPVQQQQQQQQPLQLNNSSQHSQPRSAPSTSPRSSTAGSSESGGVQNGQPPHAMTGYHENIYQGATMVAGPPTYVIPSMGIPYAPSLPAYDATGLYTTCPGYAQPMAAYPYAVVLPPPPRDAGTPAYAPSYGHHGPLAYMPQPPTACYVRDHAATKGPTHHLPIMNSYIY